MCFSTFAYPQGREVQLSPFTDQQTGVGTLSNLVIYQCLLVPFTNLSGFHCSLTTFVIKPTFGGAGAHTSNPSTLGGQARGSLEPKSSRPAQATQKTLISTKNKIKIAGCGGAPVVPATREAEVRGSLKPGEAEVAVSRDHATALQPRQQSDTLSQTLSRGGNRGSGTAEPVSLPRHTASAGSALDRIAPATAPPAGDGGHACVTASPALPQWERPNASSGLGRLKSAPPKALAQGSGGAPPSAPPWSPRRRISGIPRGCGKVAVALAVVASLIVTAWGQRCSKNSGGGAQVGAWPVLFLGAGSWERGSSQKDPAISEDTGASSSGAFVSVGSALLLPRRWSWHLCVRGQQPLPPPQTSVSARVKWGLFQDTYMNAKIGVSSSMLRILDPTQAPEKSELSQASRCGCTGSSFPCCVSTLETGEPWRLGTGHLLVDQTPCSLGW
ncbi:uncharacterized protein LOC129023484 [Pongo pygmaeus]|uniref:uncharacterized protein LOC129023484 n=1 Tax=Pongo pygmaeus TaxID=9600 RepID=UPI00300D268C